MKNLAPILAFTALAVLVIGSAIIFIDNFGPFVGTGLVAAAVGVVWLLCTWWFADDTPAFGPNDGSRRVTFVDVIQNTLRDVSKITRPLWMRAWLNLPFVAVMGVDAVSMLQPEAQQAIWHNPYTATALIILNLVARYGSTAAHAPIASR